MIDLGPDVALGRGRSGSAAPGAAQEEGSTDRFRARIRSVAINEPGVLATITEVIANNDANIQNLSMTRSADNYMDMVFDLEVWDLAHLTKIIRQLSAKPAITSVERVTG